MALAFNKLKQLTQFKIIVFLFLAAVFLTLPLNNGLAAKSFAAAASNPINCSEQSAPAALASPPVNYSYKVRAVFPHRTTAFTQGLLYHDGKLYESTGNYGESGIAEIDLASGEVLQETPLDKQYFGEGIALFNEQLIQLSWKSGQVFRYSADTIELQAQQQIEGEGWGITQNGKLLITSDGSSQLSFRDAETLAVEATVEVRFRGRPLKNLNELEWVNGCVLANVWQSQYIVVINPASGVVEGIIDLTRIIQHERKAGTQGVANGVAVLMGNEALAGNGELLVTGKNWRGIYQLKILVPD